MNTQYYFLHIELLIFLIIISAIASIVFAFFYFVDTSKSGFTGEDCYKPKWAIGFIFFLLLFLSGLTWAIAVCNEPWRQEYTSIHDIKDVIYPDGSKIQMFTCDDVHHNVTTMFGKVVDENWQIRRVRWSPVYLRVSFAGSSRCRQGNHYFLEHKNDNFPSSQITEAEISSNADLDVFRSK